MTEGTRVCVCEGLGRSNDHNIKLHDWLLYQTFHSRQRNVSTDSFYCVCEIAWWTGEVVSSHQDITMSLFSLLGEQSHCCVKTGECYEAPCHYKTGGRNGCGTCAQELSSHGRTNLLM